FSHSPRSRLKPLLQPPQPRGTAFVGGALAAMLFAQPQLRPSATLNLQPTPHDRRVPKQHPATRLPPLPLPQTTASHPRRTEPFAASTSKTQKPIDNTSQLNCKSLSCRSRRPNAPSLPTMESHPMSLPFARTALASALLGASVSTFAQDALVLGDTVVSAAGYEQKITDAPASVTVVSQEQLQKKPYAGLADALRDIEGIDVGATQDKTGNISITMRGLEAKYTLVLIDGRRQSDVGNIGPNNFGNNQFMYMPSLDAIERIEVVRGPMSTLYGADAMGGVINIITKKVKDNWGGSISYGHTFQE